MKPDPPDPGDLDRLAKAWLRLEPTLSTAVATKVAASNPQVLYDTQLTTANLLMHAEYARDAVTLEGLARVYQPAFDGIATESEAFFYYASPGGVEIPQSVWPLSRPTRMWTAAPTAGLSAGPESVLSSSQFLYAASRLVRVTAEMPAPSAALVSFRDAALPVIVVDHYARWIDVIPGQPGSFQVRGWGCHSGTYSHRQHLENLLGRRYGTAALPGKGSNPPSYCNALTDTDMWIVAGVLEILAAHARSPALVPLEPAVKAMFEAHAELGAKLIRSRFGAQTLTSPKGSVQGLTIDPGGFDGHPDHAYTGYTATSAACTGCVSVGGCTCDEFPGYVTAGGPVKHPPEPLSGVSWDISHARRLVSVFDSMRRHRGILPKEHITDDEARAFARQIAFAVWDGDLTTPRFATFLDGSNGWYRVNYSGRVAFGYPPWSMTPLAPLCGYGFWKELEPGLGPALRAAWARIDAPPDTTDAQAMRIIQGLPEAMPYRVEERACGW